MTGLAIDGGEPAVRVEDPETWERPVERQTEAVTGMIEEGFFSGAGYGPPEEFEERFADAVDAEYCLSVDHGSTALASAYYAVGVGPGDEVITPAAGYIGSYAGALHVGARPVFCETDPETLLVDPDDVEERITDRTAAINVIHKQGRVCDMDALLAIREEYDVPIVHDAAHAHGSAWDGTPVGGLADVACFSMQGIPPDGKPVAAGEGGIVTTDDRELYERQLSYCHLHRRGVTDELTREPYRNLDGEVLGRKWRAHPFAIALAAIQLDSLDERVRKRVAYRDELFEALEAVSGVRPVWPHAKSEADGLYGGLRVVYRPDELGGVPVEAFVEALQAEGVSASGPSVGHLEHLRTIHTEGYDLWGEDRGPLGGTFCGLPPFDTYEAGDFPVTEALDERVLRLPSYLEPVEGTVARTVEAFEKVAAEHERLA